MAVNREMVFPTEFDDIRPYTDSEIPAAMQRIVADPKFDQVVNYLQKGSSSEQIKALLLSINTVEQLQQKVMYPIVQAIIGASIEQFTYGGFENIDPKRGLVYVSNHRDIVMDAFLLQLALVEEHLPTTQITFGSNLMSSQFVVDIGRSNKMFKVERKSTDIRAFARASKHLSDYIRFSTVRGLSVWIAQRNGRTKNGDDQTDQGLMKMFSLSTPVVDAASFDELGMTPMAISYQWEPCDILKVAETYRSMDGKPYVKGKNEDLNSIITGITQPKGKVHIEIGRTITTDELNALSHLSKGDLNKALAQLIDSRIRSSYHLFDNNYIAHDLRSNSNRFADRYTEQAKACFEKHVEQLGGLGIDDVATLRGLLLDIYANPVDNALAQV